jgi:hypothetical protein
MQNYILLHSVETLFGADPASYQMRTGGNLLGVKLSEREADRSPPSSAEVMNDGDVPPLRHVFMALYLTN